MSTTKRYRVGVWNAKMNAYKPGPETDDIQEAVQAARDAAQGNDTSAVVWEVETGRTIYRVKP